MDAIADRHSDWTFERLEQLGEDEFSGRRLEILDGVLVVSPSVAPRHAVVQALLRDVLTPAAPPGTMVVNDLGVGIGPSYVVPDLIVAPIELLLGDAVPMPARGAGLLVEIVSPSSRTMDRIAKPALYAQAGVPNYWRVDMDPVLRLTAYRLDGANYLEVGTWGPGETARLSEPFAVAVAIDALAPRRPDQAEG